MAKRLDAEHFQPKYKALLDHLRTHAHRVRYVGEFATHCDRGAQPKYVKGGTLAIVNSQHILENGLDYENFEHTDASVWDDRNFKEARIIHGDILTYTTGAKVGRSAVYLSADRAVASNHVNLLRLRDENPIYVAGVVNSMIGRWQTRMLVSGSAQVELYPSDIRRFLIPFIGEDEEKAVASAIQGTYTSRRQVNELLARATYALQVAIENSESAAVAFLNGG
jgi:hypothetical protein